MATGLAGGFVEGGVFFLGVAAVRTGDVGFDVGRGAEEGDLHGGLGRRADEQVALEVCAWVNGEGASGEGTFEAGGRMEMERLLCLGRAEDGAGDVEVAPVDVSLNLAGGVEGEGVGGGELAVELAGEVAGPEEGGGALEAKVAIDLPWGSVSLKQHGVERSVARTRLHVLSDEFSGGRGAGIFVSRGGSGMSLCED